ncbi:hypothetical protein [Spiroplasma alleghenense]|uniref:Uncharacterized protein n=1 Tax=Spiroplasma alleghenense TaxID=216931 RepID=A0A345Z3I5_9MOLU|nr:hypothetical protein [Spiroplasma alleghenense]AXK51164.1 hypothetical protein SALLE_v1c04900 [Spiroplasma alleghenense]
MNNKYIWAFENKTVKSIFILSILQGIFLILISPIIFTTPELFKINSLILFLSFIHISFLYSFIPLFLGIMMIVFSAKMTKINVKDKSMTDMDVNLEKELPQTISKSSSFLSILITVNLISLIFILIWFLKLLAIDTYFQSKAIELGYDYGVVFWGSNILKNASISTSLRIAINFISVLPFLIIPIFTVVFSFKVLSKVKENPLELFKSDFIKSTKKMMTSEDIIKKSELEKEKANKFSNKKSDLTNNGKISDFKNFNQRMADEKNHWDDLTKVDGLEVNLNNDISELESLDYNLKNKCEIFFKKAIQVFEKGGNTNNDMYKKFRVTYSALIDNSLDHKLDQVENSINDYIKFTSEADLKFINKIEDLMRNNSGFFSSYSEILYTLISKYKNSLEKWELLEAEVAIEQIFAIALNYQNLIAKVGFCIKHRLVNNFDSIEKENNLITKLDFARDNKKFSTYKLICEETILLMSPIKEKLKKFIEELS